MSVQGIDVASYQSSDFNAAGLGFVFVKATEGTSYVNPRHAAQVAHGRAHHLVIGHYHFARPGSMTSQAAYFLKHAAPRAGDVLALDWEDPAVGAEAKDALLHAIESQAPAHQAVLYCNRDFWLHRDTTSYAGDGLWIADPDAPAGHPRIGHPWLVHQHSSAGGLDRNVAAFEDAASLRAWAAKGATPTPAQVPAHRYQPYPGRDWFAVGRRSPVVTAMHQRLVAVGCGRYRSHTHLDTIGPGDIASYEAWQRHYSTAHHKGWTGAAVQWPPGRESWDALQVPHI